MAEVTGMRLIAGAVKPMASNIAPTSKNHSALVIVHPNTISIIEKELLIVYAHDTLSYHLTMIEKCRLPEWDKNRTTDKKTGLAIEIGNPVDRPAG
jgi:hypothetical protein